MPPLLKVGITGGIGSGKTTVCRIFESMGIPVYYADERARWLMNHDAQLKEAIQERFGAEAYDQRGELNRAYMASVVFSDAGRLQELNGLVHPAVALDGERWHASQPEGPYALREAALIFESGSYRLLDKVIVVSAPRALRLGRVMARDGVDQAAVEARMSKQLPEEEKVKRADYLIQNDGKQLLIPQVVAVHRQLLVEAKKRSSNYS